MEKKRRTIRIIMIKCAALFCILATIVWSLGSIFMPYHISLDQAYTFHECLEDDSMDVIIVGASTLRGGASSNVLWHDYDILSYARCTAGEPIDVTWLSLNDSFKTQSPKVVLIDARALLHKYDYDSNEAYVRRGMDAAPLSFEKIKVAWGICQKSTKHSLLSFLFPLLRYHSRWGSLDYEEISKILHKEIDYLHGQTMLSEQFDASSEDNASVEAEDDKQVELSEDALFYYNKIFELCRKKGAAPVLVYMPSYNIRQKKIDALESFAKEANVDLINVADEQVMKKYGIDLDSDLGDKKHLNIVGAEKATLYIGDYLRANYDLSDCEHKQAEVSRYNDDYVRYNEEATIFKEEKYKTEK